MMAVTHDRLRELFIAACDLPPNQQDDLISRECGGDEQLISELRALLSNDDTKTGFLAEGELTPPVNLQVDSIEATTIPDRIGRYRIKSLIGEGGMGRVYLAEQENPKREVAIKVIRGGITNQEVLKRFGLETEVLGRLQHPGIAKILEAGTFRAGGIESPFFAMEFVDGIPLRKYLSQHQPEPNQKLRMFQEICAAVHHAHQRGVIHRDLKPANIMVDQSNHIRVLDFGVSRATDPDIQAHSIETATGQLVGTVPYMSPEQIGGRQSEIDTRSDIYSLGVILFETLTGHLPYDLADASLLVAVRTVADQEPAQLKSFDKRYQGDLNRIVSKALEKNPQRRYQTADALSSDVSRFLNRQPILARPPTVYYQLKKFAERNTLLVVATALVLLTLVGGTIGTTWGMLSAQRENRRVQAVNDFMSKILVSPDPVVGNANARMSDVLRRAVDDARNEFLNYPETEAEVCHLLGLAFGRLSLFDDSEIAFERAYQLRIEHLGNLHPRTLESGLRYVDILVITDAKRAVEVASQLLAIESTNDPNERTELELQRLVAEARSRLGQFQVSVAELRDVIDRTIELDGDSGDMAFNAKSALADVLLRQTLVEGHRGKSETTVEAEKLYRELIEKFASLKGDYEYRIVLCRVGLIEILICQNRFKEAEAMCQNHLQPIKDHLGVDHFTVKRVCAALAEIRYEFGQYDEAAKLGVQLIETTRTRSGGENWEVLIEMFENLPILEAASRWSVGEEYCRTILEKLGSYPAVESLNQLYLARFLSGQQKYEEAEEWFSRFADSDANDGQSIESCAHELFWGEHLQATGKLEAAKKHLQKAILIRGRFSEFENPRMSRIELAIERANKRMNNGKERVD